MTEHPEEFIYDPYFITFALIIIISFSLLVIFYIINCHPTRHAIMILGLPRSGKTTVFTRLAYSRFRTAGTYPSETIDKYFSLLSRWRIVDTPGQVKIKHIYFNYYKSCAKAIIFVIDLVTINENKYRIAEYLDRIITDPVTSNNRIPLLILCNRHDDLPLIDLRAIGRFLERQIDIYRQYLSDKEDEELPEEKDGLYEFNVPLNPFYFRTCPLRVDFASCPTFTDDTDDSELEEIVEWITTV